MALTASSPLPSRCRAPTLCYYARFWARSRLSPSSPSPNAISCRHRLAPRSCGSHPLGGRTGRQLDIPVPRLPDYWRWHLLAAVLLRPHHRYGPLPAHFGEKLTGGKIAGFIAAACGAFLIAAQGLGGNMPIAGIVCGIASAFCYALMVIASKGAPHIEGLENSTLQVSAAFVTALVLRSSPKAPPRSSPSIAAGIDWRAVAMLGIVNTGLGCLLYFSAVAKLPVQTVAVVGYLEPLSAVVFSAVLWAKP
ncbi:MAG: DMT family transporter [Collinsella sp.]